MVSLILHSVKNMASLNSEKISHLTVVRDADEAASKPEIHTSVKTSSSLPISGEDKAVPPLKSDIVPVKGDDVALEYYTEREGVGISPEEDLRVRRKIDLYLMP